MVKGESYADSHKVRFTVFTPAYNRADTLERPFESLRNQTFKNFEWIIVVDQSTDETLAVAREFAERTDIEFPIRVFEGSKHYDDPGKQQAYNLGVKQAYGELFGTLDSDDECVPEALERFDHHWRKIPDDLVTEFAGIACLCKDQHGQIVGDLFPAPVVDVSGHEIDHFYRIEGEKWGCIRTELLREYPFPSFTGERHVPEQVIWTQLKAKYVGRHVNEALRIYWRDEEDQEAISDQEDPSKHADGHALLHRTILNYELKPRYFFHNPAYFFRSGVNISRFTLHAGRYPISQYSSLESSWAKLMFVFCLPVAIAVYARERLRFSS